MFQSVPSRRTLLASGIAAAITSLAGPSSRPVRANAGDLAWGANGHPFTAYAGIPWETQLDIVRALGMSQYRVNLRLEEPYADLEAMLPMARARGITLLPVLQPDGDMDHLSARELGRRSFEVGRNMASRFKGRIPVWELHNELENYAIIQPCERRFDGTKYPCDWGPAAGLGVLDYHPGRWPKVSAIIGGLSRGVKAGDPDALRAAGTAGWGHLGAYQRLAADGVEWDITVWHDYEGVPEDTLAFLAMYGKPIWITEFNADVGGTPPLSPEEHARRLSDRIAHYRAMSARYRIEAAHVYELLDEDYWGDTFEARMGLIRIEKDGEAWKVGQPKPAAVAVHKALTGGRRPTS